LGQITSVSIDLFVRTRAEPPREFAWAWALERPASEQLSVYVVPELAVPLPLPKKDNLFLWFGVPHPQCGPNLPDHLSEEEHARAAKFRFEADRWAYTAAHAGIRVLLGQMVGCAPHKLRFQTSATGKPYLDHKDLCAAVQFSISHTRGCVAVAVARCAVGVDVERRRQIPDMMAVARMAFAPEARAALVARSDRTARMALFYRYWTLGEAFIKATGEGIAQDLTSFAFTAEGAPALTRVSSGWGPVGRWRFCCVA
jgi:4'-phosphopantetheinyl transferase